MKVIERGEPEKTWPRRFTCRHCKSILELEVGDCKENTDYQGGFSSYFIDCPVCLEQPDVPQSWWSLLHREHAKARQQTDARARQRAGGATT